jgi:HK97 family phage portal protein
MTFVRALRREERAVQATAWGDWGGSGSETWAGVSVDPSSSIQQLTVYGCTAFIVDGITTLPLDCYRNTPDGKLETPKPAWLKNPSPGLDFAGWAGQNLTSLLLAGNAFNWMDFAPGEGLASLTPLDPTKVTVRRERGMKQFLIGGSVYDSSRILHIPGLMFPGADVGLSPVEMARQTIGGALAAEEHAGRFFEQGATLSGVIEMQGDLTPENAKLMARAWRKAHSGKDKAHLPGVLVGGASWKPITSTNKESQFLEQRKFTAAQIAGLMFRVDPAELGIPIEGSSLTYTNQEQRNIRKVQVTFLPWIIRLENAISALLPQPRYVKFNVDGLLRGDQKARFETYKIASDINAAAAQVGEPPLLTTREMREFEDFEPLPAPTESV